MVPRPCCCILKVVNLQKREINCIFFYQKNPLRYFCTICDKKMRIRPRKNSPVSVTDLLFLIDLTDDSSKLWPKNEEKNISRNQLHESSWIGQEGRQFWQKKRKQDQRHAIVPMYFLRKLLGNQKVLQKSHVFLNFYLLSE